MMRINVTINRLLALAQFLRELPRRAFDMGCWVRKSNEDLLDIDSSKHSYKKTPECGMAGCLGGWATHIVPELVLKGGYLYNTRTHQRESRAFADAFGITTYDSNILTDGDAEHKTPKAAAKVVELLAANIAEVHDYEIVNA